jgi:ubiquitin C-terminal hydrolase
VVGEVTGITFDDGARTAVFVTRKEPKTIEALAAVVEAVTPKWGRVCEETVTVVLRPGERADLGILRRRELPAPRQSRNLTLEDCLTFHSEPEKLGENDPWICERCDQIVHPEKKDDIWSVPEVLIIHLKRFSSQGRHLSKRNDLVDYPCEIDLRKFVIGPQKDAELKYRFYAVSNHYGGLGGGHYTANAIVQDPMGDPDLTAPWFSFNDSSASGSGRDKHSSAAYLLFYEKVT